MSKSTPATERTHLGEMLRLYRHVKNIDAKALAAQMNVGPSTIHKLETGNGVQTETLLELVRWLFAPDVPPSAQLLEPAAPTTEAPTKEIPNA